MNINTWPKPLGMQKLQAWERLLAAEKPSSFSASSKGCENYGSPQVAQMVRTQHAVSGSMKTPQTMGSSVGGQRKRGSSRRLVAGRQKPKLCPPDLGVPIPKGLESQEQAVRGQHDLQIVPSSQEQALNGQHDLPTVPSRLPPFPGTRALHGQLTMAERGTVKFPQQYEKPFALLKKWCLANSRSLEPLDADATLADYLDVKLAAKMQTGDAEKVVAAAVYQCPGLERKSLVRANRSLRGFRKLRPPGSRLPLVEDVVCGLVACLVLMDRPLTALAVFTSCQCYLRPGEAVAVQCKDVGLPMLAAQSGLECFTLTIAPSERGVASKVQTFDDTIIVDKPDWLGVILGDLSRTGLPSAPLFQLTMKEYKQDWEEACRMLGVKAHLYQLRHAGASLDTLGRRRSAEEIGDRGRWMTSKSRKRYAKGGAVQRVWRRLNAETRTWCSVQARQVQNILTGRVNLSLPPKVVTAVSLIR